MNVVLKVIINLLAALRKRCLCQPCLESLVLAQRETKNGHFPIILVTRGQTAAKPCRVEPQLVSLFPVTVFKIRVNTYFSEWSSGRTSPGDSNLLNAEQDRLPET